MKEKKKKKPTVAQIIVGMTSDKFFLHTFLHHWRPWAVIRVKGIFRKQNFTVRTGEPLGNYSPSKPVPEAFEFPAFDYFLANQRPARSPQNFSWAVQREDSRRGIQTKFSKVEEIANLNTAAAKENLH